MAAGDKLHSLQFPHSVQNQLRQQGRLIAKLAAQLNTIVTGNSDGTHSVGTPMPDPVHVDLVVTQEYAKDGTYRPALTIAVAQEYARIRGFMGYRARLTSPTGEKRIIECGTYEAPTGILPTEFVARNLHPPLYSDSTDTWTCEVQVRSFFGDGKWSVGKTFAITSSSDIIATPSAPSVAGRQGVLMVEWTLPSDPHYLHTEVWVGKANFTIGSGSPLPILKAVVYGSKAIVAYDIVSDAAAPYNTVKIRHITRSGLASTLSAGTSLTGTYAAMTIVGGHLDPVINYDGVVTLTTAGRIRSAASLTDGATYFGTAGLEFYAAVDGLGGNNGQFYDADGNLIGRLEVLGPDVSLQVFSPGEALRIGANTLVRIGTDDLILRAFIRPDSDSTVPLAIKGSSADQTADYINVLDHSGATRLKQRVDGSILQNAISGISNFLHTWAVNGTNKLWIDSGGQFWSTPALQFRATGDGYGGAGMVIRNTGGLNGVAFTLYPDDSSIDLIDCQFNYPGGGTNLRVENRVASVYVDPGVTGHEYQLGTAGSPHTAMSGAGLYQRSGYIRGVYHSSDNTAGFSGTVVLAKITVGGANGSFVVKDGIVTAYTAPT